MRKQLWLSLALILAGCATERVEVSGPRAQRDSDSASEEQERYSPDVRKAPEPNWEQAAKDRLNLGLQYLDKGQIARAKRNLDLAIKYKPDLPEVQYGMGYYYQRVKETNLAEQYFRKAISVAPKNANAHNIYGAFLCEQERYEDAEDHFQDAMAARDYDQQTLTLENAGICALKAGEAAKAEAHFLRALSYNPGQGRPLLELGNLELERGQVLKAQDYLKRYLADNRHTPRSLWLGIRVARQTGDNNAYASYALLLTQQYGQSEEAQLFQQARSTWQK
ncbi:MAG: type IV pilus biogenesis/stability protein PilW [Gammaproteobacteria bacterium]|nr:type IV pilus biogenesis/stability protein PilW [Gammaproteobacteria bacterium]